MKRTRGTLVETLTQDDPKSGSAITSSAATSVQGGPVFDSSSICPAVLTASTASATSASYIYYHRQN